MDTNYSEYVCKNTLFQKKVQRLSVYLFAHCPWKCTFVCYQFLPFMMLLEIQNLPSNYAPIAIQLVLAVAFVAVMMAATHFLGPKRMTSDKLENFECGIEQEGNARQPLAVKYFLVAILFVLFDVEVIFFYPYAINFRELGWNGFMAVAMFVSFFIVGFVYIIKKGALQWED